MVGARIKIMWEEQLVDPPNEYIILFCLFPDKTKAYKGRTNFLIFATTLKLQNSAI